MRPLLAKLALALAVLAVFCGILYAQQAKAEPDRHLIKGPVVALASTRAAPEEVAACRTALHDALGSNVRMRLVPPGAEVDELTGALRAKPALIVIVGPHLAGATDVLSASWLDQRFLILGAQLAEPTANVWTITWPGADQRAALSGDPAPFGAARTYAERAVRRGLDAVEHSEHGAVYHLD